MVILADTSAWIAYFRQTGSPANLRLRASLASDEVSTTDIVQLEVLRVPATADICRSCATCSPAPLTCRSPRASTPSRPRTSIGRVGGRVRPHDSSTIA